MTRRRLAAIVALTVGAATVALATVEAVRAFPRGLVVAACVAVAGLVAWYGLLRRGLARLAGLTCGALAICAAVVVLVTGGPLLAELLVVVGAIVFVAAVRGAFAFRVDLSPVPRPKRAVLFFNPRSGGGKAERFSIASEARARGIEPIELRPGSELGSLVREAVAQGADGLAMAGGDGSQAIVAAVAAEHGLPYACVPTGTRNHFALDLGVDRHDPVGALDAFVDGGERRVDLADVNGRVFVNNVSLGLYAEAVQREGYRDAKLRTLLDTVPDVLGPDGDTELDLEWAGPGGEAHHSGAAILVSNNPYRLGRAVGSGTRPSIDRGVLGVAVLDMPNGTPVPPGQRPWREWSAPAFEIQSRSPVAAGIDGEAVRLEPPLRFGIRERALRVRISRRHPGASPSARTPERIGEGLLALVRIVAGSAPG
jgi:hypothetical protein